MAPERRDRSIFLSFVFRSRARPRKFASIFRGDQQTPASKQVVLPCESYRVTLPIDQPGHFVERLAGSSTSAFTPLPGDSCR